MTIKEGSLVKAWDDNPTNPDDYTVGIYYGEGTASFPFEVVFDGDMIQQYKNAIEIPPELEKALKELGNE